MHWAKKYIGLPWVSGAQGPDEFDCWGFFRYVQREEYGRTLPFIDVDAENIYAVSRALRDDAERTNWKTVETPTDGCAVLLAHMRFPSHVGIWVDDGVRGGVLHCVRGMGVVFGVAEQLKLSGWGRVEYFEYVGK